MALDDPLLHHQHHSLCLLLDHELFKGWGRILAIFLLLTPAQGPPVFGVML